MTEALVEAVALAVTMALTTLKLEVDEGTAEMLTVSEWTSPAFNALTRRLQRRQMQMRKLRPRRKQS
jgi:hypothetical protein